VESRNSLPFSHNPITGSYPEPHESSAHSPILLSFPRRGSNKLYRDIRDNAKHNEAISLHSLKLQTSPGLQKYGSTCSLYYINIVMITATN